MANEVEITITATDLTGPAFAGALAKMEALKKAAGDISFGRIDTNALGSDLMTLRSKLQSLGIADLADINIPPGRITQQLQFLKRMIEQNGISDLLDFNVNDANLAKQLAKVGSLSETIPVNFDISRIPNLAKLFSTETVDVKRVFVGNAGKPPSILSTQNMDETFRINGLLAAEAQLAATNTQTKALADNFGRLEVSKDSLASDIKGKLVPAVRDSGGTGAGGFGWWGNALGGTIGTVGIWHVALDLAVEGLVSITSAALAAGIGIAAMTPAAMDIYHHLQNLNTISDALNHNIPPMTGNFSKLSDSLKPNVVEAYGGALYLVNRNTGVFGTVAHEVAIVLDDWIAKIDLWDSSQSGMGKLLQSGVGFLQQFGSILGKVLLGVDNLLQKDPGIARFLLDFISGAASLLDLITKLPGPILATGLALHGVYVYGNVALGALGSLVGAFGGAETAAGKASKALKSGFDLSILASPWTWVAAGAAVLGYLAYEALRADASTQDIINTMNQNLANANFSQGLKQFSSDFASLSSQMKNEAALVAASAKATNDAAASMMGPNALMGLPRIGGIIDATGKQTVKAWADVGNAMTGQGSVAKAAASVWDIFSQALTGADNNTQQTTNNIVALTAQQKNLIGQFSNSMVAELALEASGNSAANSMNLLNQAGVKVTDSLPLMIQKVNNLIAGYQNLGIGAGQDAAMFNALNYSTAQADNALGQYDKAMQSATSAEAQLFGVLIGGQSTMYSFLTAIQQMQTDAKISGASLDSLNSQSVKLGSDLYGSVLPAAESFINAIQMQGASQKMLIPIIANTAGNILQLTGQNKAAKLAVVDLINGAIGPGTVSMQSLDNWVGKNSVSQQQFAKDVYTSEQNASSLAGVLNKNLIPMMNQAFIQATNLAPAMKTWFTDVINGTAGTAQGQKDRANLIRDIINAGTAAHDSAGQIEGMISQVLNIPKSKAVQLYLQASGSGNITFNEKIFGRAPVTGGLAFLAGGGRLPGYGGGDRWPAMLESGETVVDKKRSKDWAWVFQMMGVPGYASGGIAGLVPRISNTGMNFITGTEASFGKSVENSFAQAAISSLKTEVAKQAAAEVAVALNYLPIGGGPISSSAAVAQAFARSILFAYGWTQAQWPYELALWNRESGWNSYAANPTSNARGIPQNINGWSAYAPGDYQAQVRWGDAYISLRYGTPANAWAHETAYGWYDDGGWLRPGWNLAYNGTGRPERVPNPNNGDGPIQLEISASGETAFERFMIMAIREWVTLKGGGNVQKAFGIPGR